MSCGPVPRRLSFMMNDWEPAIHARNLMLLQMFLGSSGYPGVGEVGPYEEERYEVVIIPRGQFLLAMVGAVARVRRPSPRGSE